MAWSELYDFPILYFQILPWTGQITLSGGQRKIDGWQDLAQRWISMVYRQMLNFILLLCIKMYMFNSRIYKL